MNYQYLKTLHKYLKQLNLKTSYPDTYSSLLTLFMQRSADLIPLCNDETVHVPLESLTFLSKLDQSCCTQVCTNVMPGIIQLYSRYYSDGMIGADIVDLLKLWARIPHNTAFTQLFLHQQIYPVIKQFH